jgi:mannose-6-phosphate isomerase-like protein (cupin superfamily)
MHEVTTKDSCQVFHLPGRDWYYLVGPQNTATKHFTFGVAEFNPGQGEAPSHRHATQEEVIYILEGEGKFVTPEKTEPLRPGMAVFIPIGQEHQIVLTGDRPLKFISAFSPPVVPGSYDAKKP